MTGDVPHGYTPQSSTFSTMVPMKNADDGAASMQSPVTLKPDARESQPQLASRMGWLGVALLLLDGVIAAAAPPIDIWYLHSQNTGGQVPLESGAAFIGVTAFTGIWLLERRRHNRSSLNEMRSAIAGSFIIVYLVILSWSAFFPARYNIGAINSLTSRFTTNFTVLTGVVVGFYFTTTAAVQIIGHFKGAQKEQTTEIDLGG
jgi:hypothetical protein